MKILRRRRYRHAASCRYAMPPALTTLMPPPKIRDMPPPQRRLRFSAAASIFAAVAAIRRFFVLHVADISRFFTLRFMPPIRHRRQIRR